MKRKGIVVSLLLALIVSTMPFRIYAASITSANIVGINRYYRDPEVIRNYTSTINGNSRRFADVIVTYEFEVLLDDYYIGWAQLSASQQVYNSSSSTGSISTITLSTSARTYYVNGNSVRFTGSEQICIEVINNDIGDPATNTNPSYSLFSSSLTKYEDLNSMDQLLQIMQDVAANVDDVEDLLNDANGYLSDLVQFRQWQIPYESLSWNIFMMKKNFTITEIVPLNNYQYPIFLINQNDIINRFYVTQTGDRNSYSFVFLIAQSVPNQNRVSDYISFSDGTISNYEMVNQFADGTRTYTICKFDLSGFSTAQFVDMTYIASASVIFIPILSTFRTDNISTDFALTFNLNNRELTLYEQMKGFLETIANGTQQSNSAATQLETKNNQMADDMDDMADIEDGYSTQFNDQLNNIDLTSPLSQNTRMGYTANFVITIFNGLIANNPLSILILVVCILMIAKKVIGK